MAPKPITIIRADASAETGSGHVMRCISLAQALLARDRQVAFVCRTCDGDIQRELTDRGFAVLLQRPGVDVAVDAEWDWRDDASQTLRLAEDNGFKVEWVIVDHYGLDERWHRAVAASGARIAVVDDLADRHLYCDLLVDQNMVEQIHARYPSLVPAHCIKLLGSEYTLLRQEFRQIQGERNRSRLQPDQSHVLLFMGGTDSQNLTMRVLRHLDLSSLPCPLVVIVGALNQNTDELHQWCSPRGIALWTDHRNVGKLIPAARAAITAGGMFAVELQAIGVPSALVPLSDIQRTVARQFAGAGGAVILEPHDIQGAGLATAVAGMLDLPLEGSGIIPLDGAARVVETIIGISQ